MTPVSPEAPIQLNQVRVGGGGDPPGPPDDGDGDHDGDHDEDDDLSDERVLSQLKQLLGGRSGGSKEADTVKVPSFPQPVPLLSALSSITTGEFARKVDRFKERRQVLLMAHEFFSTNIKHGATYSLNDLFNVRMRNDNLCSFIVNWDSVATGVTHLPEESALETLFYQQVKNHKAIAHDIQEYHRAEEGTRNTATSSYMKLSSAISSMSDWTIRGGLRLVWAPEDPPPQRPSPGHLLF